MMKKAAYCILLLCISFSCKNNGTAEQTVSSTTIETDAHVEESTLKFSLNDYPTAYLKEEGLEEWVDFEKLYQSMSRLSELNFEDVEVDLLALTTRVKNISKKQFPGSLEVPQLRSRLKVMEMQVLKSRYFTRHYKKDSLIPSIEKVYEAYNAFISRMLSLKEESTAVSSETVEID
jgi:hypothetical protein